MRDEGKTGQNSYAEGLVPPSSQAVREAQGRNPSRHPATIPPIYLRDRAAQRVLLPQHPKQARARTF